MSNEKNERIESYRNRALYLRSLGNPDKAIAEFEKAIEIDPNDPLTWTCLGNALKANKQYEKAIDAHLRAVEIKPDFAEAWSNLGLTYKLANKMDHALESFQKAVLLRPELSDLQHNLGNILLTLGQLDEAQDRLQKAIEINPKHVRALSDLGTVFKEQGKIGQAITTLEQALSIEPNNADAHWNLGLTLLLQGDFKQGWAEYEWRQKIPDIKIQHFSKPMWDGSPLGNKTLLLHAEQGLGDSIQFIRFANSIKRQNGKVIFDCPRSLVRLLKNCKGIDEIVPRDQKLPAFDCHAPLLSLPYLLGIEKQTMPNDGSYLFAEESLLKKWESVFNLSTTKRSEINIGIFWQGNPEYRADSRRSLPLQCLAPIAKINGVHLFSLQKGIGQEQISALTDPFEINDLSSSLDNGKDAFVDSAAVLQLLDLVVCSDSAIAHLASALGKETWLLLCAIPDWRWGIYGNHCPWYPKMRIFRQQKAGQWSDVINEVCTVLKERSEKF